MPNFNALSFLPIPCLRNYAIGSALCLVSATYWSFYNVSRNSYWKAEFNETIDNANISDQQKELVNQSIVFRMLYFVLSDQFCLWVVVNTALCCMLVTGKAVQLVVFGRLRGSEQQLMRDRLWNFAFYKFIFVFGVLNVNNLDELLLWMIWFSSLGFFQLLAGLAHDRFKHVTASAGNSSGVQVGRVILMLGLIIFAAFFCLILAGIVSHRVSIGYGCFLAIESILLIFRSCFGLVRYSLHWLSSSGKLRIATERNHALLYYSQLSFELLILFTEFIQYMQMLLWANIFLSLASLVIIMQLRTLYHKIDRFLRRHRNFQRISKFVQDTYPIMDHANLVAQERECCAICWDRMDFAYLLPCGHCFHLWCLRSWLEQDTASSCPTCRVDLNIPREASAALRAEPADDRVLAPAAVVPADANNNGDAAARRRRPHQAAFFFDGARYSRWLPSFSVQVSHNLSQRFLSSMFSGGGDAPPSRASAAENAQRWSTQVGQIREVFPDMSASAIVADLVRTNSVDATIENILQGSVANGPDEDEPEEHSDVTEEHSTTNYFNLLMDNDDNLTDDADTADETHSEASTSDYEDTEYVHGIQPDAHTETSTASSQDDVMDGAGTVPDLMSESYALQHLYGIVRQNDHCPSTTSRSLKSRKIDLFRHNRQLYCGSVRAVDLRERYTHDQLFSAGLLGPSAELCDDVMALI